ncbi:calcium-binding protein [Paracoccus albicereus]|nr:calcium-binding protein [Paracoccus albicereus]
MAVMRHVATFTAADYLSRVSDLSLARVDGHTVLFSASERGGGLTAFAVDGALDPLRIIDERVLTGPAQAMRAPQTALIDLPSGSWILPIDARGSSGGSWQVLADGTIGSAGRPLDARVLGSGIVEIGQFETVSGQFIFTAQKASLTLTTWRLNADGSLGGVSISPMPLMSEMRDATFDSIQAVDVGGRKILVTVSALGNFIATHQVSDDGRLTRGEYMHMESGTGFNMPRDLVTVMVDGKSFAVMSSSAASSLTVFRIAVDGSFQPTDHVIDELSTRFRGATALAAAEVGGRGYVFAGGTDDGVSMFLMQPDGKLMHLDTIGGDQGVPLRGVSDIEATVIDGKIVLFVSSAGAAGIVQFVIEPGPVGLTVTTTQDTAQGTAQDDYMVAGKPTIWMHGGAGDDTLVAGESSIAMLGGQGADTFVASNITGRIAIKDFEVGVDKLDLSQLGMVRSVYQLTVVPQSYGAKVFYHSAVIDIFTNDGRTLPASFFTNALFPIAHYTPPGSSTQIYGSDRGDMLRASLVGSTIRGRGGNDVILGGTRDDTLIGGDGHDAISGGLGADVLYGERHNDRLRGGGGRDRLFGGDGNDTLLGEDGDDALDGGPGADLLLGGIGNDRLKGGSGNDYLQGEDGDDHLDGGLGDDRLNGGRGNDTLIDTAGRNRLFGHDGDDVLLGGIHRDTLDGGMGNDTLTGGSGDNILAGGAGNDVIMAGRGNDRARGGLGNDYIDGESGDDFLHGAQANDTLRGGEGRDTLLGGDGDDLMDGGPGDDTLVGELGNDTLEGGDGNDRLRGLSGNDALFGSTGDDWMNGGGGNDTLDGGDDNDTLYGLNDDDLLRGGAGNDFLAGETGNDWLDGGDGQDRLSGGPGDDTLFGGRGADRLDGGSGLDLYLYRDALESNAATGIDTITGFTRGDDHVDLSVLDLGFIFNADFTGARELRFVYGDNFTRLEADLDGDLVADLQIILTGIIPIERGDLIL